MWIGCRRRCRLDCDINREPECAPDRAQLSAGKTSSEGECLTPVEDRSREQVRAWAREEQEKDRARRLEAWQRCVREYFILVRRRKNLADFHQAGEIRKLHIRRAEHRLVARRVRQELLEGAE